MRRSWIAAAALVAAGAVAAVVLVNSGDEGGPSAKPVAVELKGSAKVKTIKVGVVFSKSSENPADGRDWYAAASGAEVGAARFANGKTKVEVVVRDDQGTSQGSVASVEDLISAKVSGIVMATSGPHLTEAVRTATEAGVPVILPYARSVSDLPDGAWTTGVTDAQLLPAVERSLADLDATKPFVVSEQSTALSGLAAVDTATVSSTTNPAKFAVRVANAYKDGLIDSLVIDATATLQADLVREVLGKNSETEGIKILLSPEALSPVFGSTLVRTSGSTPGGFYTVGADSTDVTATGPGKAGDRMTAFFAAVRLLAQDPEALSAVTGAPWRVTGAASDVASQDAVVALVSAALAADSNNPEKVSAKLKQLKISGADGLSGPALDFSSSQALPDDAIRILRATGDDPGLRPAGAVLTGNEEQDADLLESNELFWFALPQQQG